MFYWRYFGIYGIRLPKYVLKIIALRLFIVLCLYYNVCFCSMYVQKKYYLELTFTRRNVPQRIDFFKSINSLTINPFEASFEAILNAKCRRMYSKHEATVLLNWIFMTLFVIKMETLICCNNNAKDTNDNNSNEIMEFNNVMECTNQIAKEIKEALNLTEKDKCHKRINSNFLSLLIIDLYNAIHLKNVETKMARFVENRIMIV